MSNKKIYITLIQAGFTPEGACGLMGNMMAESTMKSNIVQRGMSSYSDEQYTLMVDMGQINFDSDSIGYGLCQWTYGPRKSALLDFAKSENVSIGNEDMQVRFCIKEIKDFPDVYKILTTSHDLKECSDIVCTQYERPAINNLDDRYKFAIEFYNKFGVLNPPNKKKEKNQSVSSVNDIEYSPHDPYKNNDQKQGPLSFTDFFSALISPFKPTKFNSTTSATMPILKEGDCGAGVAAIQVALKYHKIDLGTTGNLGIWEEGTTKAVKEFQNKNGISITGMLDGITWSKLML